MPNTPPHPIPSHNRDHGLIRGIGTAAFAAAILNGVVGAGIFTLPANLAQVAGRAAPLAYLVCAIIMAGIVICFAEAGSRVPTSGGVYGTVEAAFGPAAGFVVGILLFLSDTLACGGIAALVADTIGTLAPTLATPFGRAAIIIALFAALAAANLIGVRKTARLITAATALKLLPLIFFLALGALAITHPAPPGPAPTPFTWDGFGRALILTLFALCGMETPLAASGELRHAHRALPIALFTAMLLVVALYVGIQLAASHMLGTSLAGRIAPLADAAATFGPIPRAILLGGAFLSGLAWMTSDVLGSSRLLFAFGRDGRFPALLGKLTRTTRVPANAVLGYVIITGLLAITGSFLELIVLSTLTVVGMYSMACVAALVLQRRHVAQSGPPLNLRILPLAAATGLLGMAAILCAATWQERAALAAVIILSLIIHHLPVGRKSKAMSAPPTEAISATNTKAMSAITTKAMSATAGKPMPTPPTSTAPPPQTPRAPETPSP